MEGAASGRGGKKSLLIGSTSIVQGYGEKIPSCKNLSLGYNDIASGQNSAPCRVVAGLRSPKPYIPGFLFCLRHSKAAAGRGGLVPKERGEEVFRHGAHLLSLSFRAIARNLLLRGQRFLPLVETTNGRTLYSSASSPIGRIIDSMNSISSLVSLYFL